MLQKSRCCSGFMNNTESTDFISYFASKNKLSFRIAIFFFFPAECLFIIPYSRYFLLAI